MNWKEKMPEFTKDTELEIVKNYSKKKVKHKKMEPYKRNKQEWR